MDEQLNTALTAIKSTLEGCTRKIEDILVKESFLNRIGAMPPDKAPVPPVPESSLNANQAESR